MKSKTKYLVLLLAVLWIPFITGAWDKDRPAATTSLRSSNPQMLENQSVIEDALSNEHDFSTGGTQTGDHTQGQARAFSQATAPATRIDGAGFLSTDLGSIWVDTDDNAIYTLTATTPTWTAASDEVIATLLASARVFGSTLGVTGDFAVNTNKFTVAAATGNALVAGTFESTGVATLADASVTKTTAAPSADAQISNKKYVDDQVAANQFKSNDSQVFTGAAPTSFADLDLSATIGTQTTMVLLAITPSSTHEYSFRKNGETTNFALDNNVIANKTESFWVESDSSGVIEWKSNSSDTAIIRLMGYQKSN